MELFGTILLCLATVVAGTSPIYNVVHYGAVGDSKTDNTQAFLKAWGAACSDPRDPILLVDATGGGIKIYLLRKIVFQGPCKSKVNFQISGGLLAPNELWTRQYDTWITFIGVPGLNVYGRGVINGRGPIWWDCLSKRQCENAPYSLEFMGCDGLQLSGFVMMNSPGKHLVVYKSDGAALRGLTIKSPKNSPNTDGILISDSSHAIITQSTIGVGDDCIAIGPRSFDINVSHITCGPGHGISIGSLGRDGAEDNVEQIRISDSYIFNTFTGVRIKTWQGGAGYAKFIYYENINFTSVKGGIIVIDQYYCPNLGCPNKTGNVAISDVSYTNLQGSSTTDVAISLACSLSVPCQGITMNQVSLGPERGGSPVHSYCINAQGSVEGYVSPDVACLKH